MRARALVVGRGDAVGEDAEVRPRLEPEIVRQARVDAGRVHVVERVGRLRQQRVVHVGRRRAPRDLRPVVVLHQDHEDGLDRPAARGERDARGEAVERRHRDGGAARPGHRRRRDREREVGRRARAGEGDVVVERVRRVARIVVVVALEREHHRLPGEGGEIGGLVHPGAGVGAGLRERRRQQRAGLGLHLHRRPVVLHGVGADDLDPERQLRGGGQRQVLHDAAARGGAGAADPRGVRAAVRAGRDRRGDAVDVPARERAGLEVAVDHRVRAAATAVAGDRPADGGGVRLRAARAGDDDGVRPRRRADRGERQRGSAARRDAGRAEARRRARRQAARAQGDGAGEAGCCPSR